MLIYILYFILKYVLFIIFKNILPCCLPFLSIIIDVYLVDDQEVLKKAEDQFFKEMDDKLKSKNDGKKRTIKSKKNHLALLLLSMKLLLLLGRNIICLPNYTRWREM